MTDIPYSHRLYFFAEKAMLGTYAVAIPGSFCVGVARGLGVLPSFNLEKIVGGTALGLGLASGVAEEMSESYIPQNGGWNEISRMGDIRDEYQTTPIIERPGAAALFGVIAYGAGVCLGKGAHFIIDKL